MRLVEISKELNKFNNTDVIKIMLCDAGYKPVVFPILATETKKNRSRFDFGFGVHVKAFIAFKAFYFFLVRFPVPLFVYVRWPLR